MDCRLERIASQLQTSLYWKVMYVRQFFFLFAMGFLKPVELRTGINSSPTMHNYLNSHQQIKLKPRKTLPGLQHSRGFVQTTARFDIGPYDLVVCMLRQLGFPNWHMRWLYSYLKKKTICLREVRSCFKVAISLAISGR